MRAARVFAWATLLFALCLVMMSCRKKAAPSGPAAGGASMPVVTDASEGLLFSWLDEKGEFHTGEKVADVPMVGKDQVCVKDPAHDDGSDPDHLFIVDLRAAGLDGKYPVHVMKRND